MQRAEPLYSGLQILYMRKYFPQFKYRYVGHNNTVEFKGTLQPTESSMLYQVRIVYRGPSDHPRSYIIHPKINAKCKHVFPNDGAICLYHPNYFQWESDYLITDYTVPWLAAWIYFYEKWEETGVWFCEEYPHEIGENDEMHIPAIVYHPFRFKVYH